MIARVTAYNVFVIGKKPQAGSRKLTFMCEPLRGVPLRHCEMEI